MQKLKTIRRKLFPLLTFEFQIRICERGRGAGRLNFYSEKWMKKKTFIWANLAVLDTVFAHNSQMEIVIKCITASVVIDFFLYSVYWVEVKCLLSLMQTNTERNIDKNCEKNIFKNC